jgi:hypothetical protein
MTLDQALAKASAEADNRQNWITAYANDGEHIYEVTQYVDGSRVATKSTKNKFLGAVEIDDKLKSLKWG